MVSRESAGAREQRVPDWRRCHLTGFPDNGQWSAFSTLGRGSKPTLSGVSGTLWSIHFLAIPGDFQVVKLAWQEPVTSNRNLCVYSMMRKIPIEFSRWKDKKWRLSYHTGQWSLSESGSSAENRWQYAQIFVFLSHVHNVPLKLEISIWFVNNEFVRKFSPGTKMPF